MSKLDSIAPSRKKINHYSYDSADSIGKGYSSCVYRGNDDLTDEEVAIKLIDMKNIKGDVHKTLLSNQIEILKLLKSLQNIIQVYDVFNLKSHTCIVTQLCNGGDLAKKIKSKKCLSEKQSVQILKQIISGYRNMHKFGIVHRDLKPANIFFVNDVIKIADFGFAIKNSDLKKAMNYNVGSPVYMPLEALNDNIYSSKSDVWAIGVIFYEMLTGKTPWKAKTQTDLKRQIKAIPIKTLIPLNISESSADFLIKSLQVNQALRMSPEQMDRHFHYFSPNDSNMLTKNIISQSLRTNNLFRTRAASHEKQERIDNSIGKNTVTAPKTFRKVTMLNGINEESVQRTNLASTMRAEKHQNLIKTTATLGLTGEPNFFDHKKTSNHLISQIHFCRFLYKLILRLEQLQNLDSDNGMKNLMGTIISGKLKEITNLKCLSPKYAPIFRRTKEFQKIYNVVEQYKIKYQRILKQGAQSYSQALVDFSERIAEQISILYESVVSMQEIDHVKEEIVLLDYFITLKQLINLMFSNDIQTFHNRSKIETIVEGRPSKNITKEHIKAISQKMKALKIA